MDLSEEKKIIEEAQSNPEFFGFLFENNYSQIFGYILKRIGNVETAQDITSEVFCKALKNLWKFKWKNIPFSAWLYRISINEINNYLRKKLKYKTLSFDSLVEDIGFDIADSTDLMLELEEAQEELSRQQEFLKIKEKLSALPMKYQEVISLRYFENKKISEIALILNKKEGTIKSLIFRGLSKLK